MKCPYCLSRHSQYQLDTQTGVYRCPNCKSIVPRSYLESPDMLRSTVGVVGFSGHGKTVYLTSLFSTLGKFSKYWSGYYYRSLDDFTHRVLYEQVPQFEKGQLPESTPANFPNPALIQYHEVPYYDDCFLGFYDTAGEVFRDVDQIARAGFFVASSDVVLFIMSLHDVDPKNLDFEITGLLDTYVRSCTDRLNANLRENQSLVVIFTKGDLVSQHFNENIRGWLKDGHHNWYAQRIEERILDMARSSVDLEDWLAEDMGCNRFLNMAKDSFRDVRFCVVSATGYVDMDDVESTPEPLRVLDPFLWVLHFAHQRTQDQKKVHTSWLKRLFKSKKTKTT